MLEEACTVTSLTKLSRGTQNVGNENELQSSSTYMSSPSQRPSSFAKSPNSARISFCRQAYSHRKPSIPRSDIKDDLTNRSGYNTDQSKEGMVYLDIIHRNNTEPTECKVNISKRLDFENLLKTFEVLIESNENIKRELVQLKGVVDIYKVEYDQQRLGNKTKELEAIILTNENERLKEEVQHLREIIVAHNGDTAGLIGADIATAARTSRCLDGTRSTDDDRDLDNVDIHRIRYAALAPISKPKIYRRYSTSDARDGHMTNQYPDNSSDGEEDGLKGGQYYEHGKSRSDTCTVYPSTNNCYTADSSLSDSKI